MAIPYRGTTTAATYFVTAGTSFKQNLLQSDRIAQLFCETLFHYRDARNFRVHAFVVMPNHFHLILTVLEGSTLERAMQLIKGGFLIKPASCWEWTPQSGRRVLWIGEFGTAWNWKSIPPTFTRTPVKAGLAETAEEYRYSSLNPAFVMDELPQRLKPSSDSTAVMHR